MQLLNYKLLLGKSDAFLHVLLKNNQQKDHLENIY